MRVLVFVPHNPYPCRSGAHRRMLEVLIALRALGADVCLAAAENTAENPWDSASRAWFTSEGLCRQIHVFSGRRPSLAELALRGWRKLRPHVAGGTAAPRVDHTTGAMRKWFGAVAATFAPDVIFINYALFSGLLSACPSRGVVRVVDVHDLVSVNEAMRHALAPYMPNGAVFDPDSVPEEVLRLDYFENIDATPSAGELTAYDCFDAALAITERDAAIVRERTVRTRVFAVPTAIAQHDAEVTHARLALFPMGPHVFNLQGYAWFVRKVLPRIKARCPDFRLAVSGSIYPGVTLAHHPDVQILGFVQDAARLWSVGSILVNPVFGGTGQPIKTLEAMAAGLAPVILDAFSHAAPITNEATGFIARNEHEFAEACVSLWEDPALCAHIGEGATNAVREHCSRERFVGSLNVALSASKRPSS